MSVKEAIEKINKADSDGLELRYRYGFGFRGAEWSKSSVEALTESLENGNWAHYDLYNGDGWLGINFYSANDMW